MSLTRMTVPTRSPAHASCPVCGVRPVKQRFVRQSDELGDDEEIALRGGRLAAAIVRADAQRMHDVYGTFGISVFALRGATIDELAQQAPLVRFAELTVVTVGTLRGVGVRLEPPGGTVVTSPWCSTTWMTAPMRCCRVVIGSGPTRIMRNDVAGGGRT